MYCKNYCKVYSYYLMLMSLLFFSFGILLIYFNEVYYVDWSLLCLNSCEFSSSFVFDWMSMMFSFFVCFISSCVMYYSIEYMSGDKYMNRFGLLVFMFVLSMLLLINSYSLVMLLLGWDGLGLVSYCLVVYYQNMRSYNAGMITILSNRIGDAAILLAISWMLMYGDWFYFYFFDYGNNYWVLILCLLAAFTKSAQMPFSAWLPSAMAAPTPVSALVHSSTLVTAGVYLMIRYSYSEGYENCYNTLCFFSLLTMFMAGIGANFENDLKKIIALSTLSQLGLMMFILSIGYYELAYFHMLTHAMFKALLFMCAGSYIHTMNDNQDVRYMGGMVFYSPYIASMILICIFALFGFPFLAGFYSKDLIIQMYLSSNLNIFLLVFFMLSFGLTSCYSIRLVYYIMWGSVNWNVNVNLMDCNNVMRHSMILLSFMAIISGSMLMWLVFPYSFNQFVGWFISFNIMMMVFGGMLFGMIVMWSSLMYHNILIDFMSSMWFLTGLSGQYFSNMLLYYGGKILYMVDMGWLEYFGGQGVYFKFMDISNKNQWWQDNSFKVYMSIFLIWILMFIII